MILDRHPILERLRGALDRSPVVLLSGPRQSGKTTLARELLDPASENYFDLEDPASLARLDEPMTALRPLSGLVVIDEVQRRPDLFPVLRVLVDRAADDTRWLILGSASGDLSRQSSESLAGRLERVTIGGFSMSEVGADAARRLWHRGGFPRSFLAGSDADSFEWRRAFVRTLLERDLPQWGVRIPTTALTRFWSLVGHYHGQIWSHAEPARAMGTSEPTVRRYLDLLTDAFMLRQLQPWHANVRKRQVKSPKVYVRDSGLLHLLLGTSSMKELLEHPRVGASWEGFAIEQLLRCEPHDEAYFWATHQGAEIDVVLRRGQELLGVECKRADAPRITRSMRIAIEDLALERIAILYPGERRYALSDEIEVIPLADLEHEGSVLG